MPEVDPAAVEDLLLLGLENVGSTKLRRFTLKVWVALSTRIAGRVCAWVLIGSLVAAVVADGCLAGNS
jgi:hypothetical protein